MIHIHFLFSSLEWKINSSSLRIGGKDEEQEGFFLLGTCLLYMKSSFGTNNFCPLVHIPVFVPLVFFFFRAALGSHIRFEKRLETSSWPLLVLLQSGLGM